MSFKQVYRILAEREQTRAEYAFPTHYPSPQHAFYSVARSLKHRADNRYSNILAYDRTAVCAPRDTSDETEVGYLNANVVSDGHNWWVASQAPLPSTFQHFFQAIYDRRASKHPLIAPYIQAPPRDQGRTILVQLTGWEERGIIKADKYVFPGTHGALQVKMQKTEQRKDIQSTVTLLTLNEMEVLHYHFGGWPDHGVPDEQGEVALRKLIKEVEEKRDGEVWVHCSAGVGRTGTFIALSSLLLDHSGSIPLPESPLGPLPKDLQDDKVAKVVDGIREWRGVLVQGPDQLQLIYNMTKANER